MRKARTAFAFGFVIAGLMIPSCIALGATEVVEPPDSLAAARPAVEPAVITSLTDTPNDAGTSIDITWEVSPTEGESPGEIIEYRIFRTPAEDGEFEQVGAVPAGTTTYSDDGTEPGDPYWYKIITVGIAGETASEVYGPGYSRMQWFDRGRVGVLAYTLLTCALVLVFIEVSKRSKGKIFLRRLPVFDAIDEAIGRATEMGKKVLYIMGGLDVDDPQTVASMSILARVADRTASLRPL